MYSRLRELIFTNTKIDEILIFLSKFFPSVDLDILIFRWFLSKELKNMRRRLTTCTVSYYDSIDCHVSWRSSYGAETTRLAHTTAAIRRAIQKSQEAQKLWLPMALIPRPWSSGERHYGEGCSRGSKRNWLLLFWLKLKKVWLWLSAAYLVTSGWLPLRFVSIHYSSAPLLGVSLFAAAWYQAPSVLRRQQTTGWKSSNSILLDYSIYLDYTPKSPSLKKRSKGYALYGVVYWPGYR